MALFLFLKLLCEKVDIYIYIYIVFHLLLSESKEHKQCYLKSKDEKVFVSLTVRRLFQWLHFSTVQFNGAETPGNKTAESYLCSLDGGLCVCVCNPSVHTWLYSPPQWGEDENSSIITLVFIYGSRRPVEPEPNHECHDDTFEGTDYMIKKNHSFQFPLNFQVLLPPLFPSSLG